MSEKQKLGRNDPCWCGSGKKYKHCHMHQDQAEAKESAVEPATAMPAPATPAPMKPAKPEPRPIPPELALSPLEGIQALDARWEQFEAADLEGKVALFLETLASGEMDSEESYEMLQSIRGATDPRHDPQARVLYAELVERLCQEAPDLYRYDLSYYHENLINDAIAEERWEAIPGLLAGFAGPPVDRGIDIFFHLIDQMRYHGQIEPLIHTMKQMWPGVLDAVASEKLLPWDDTTEYASPYGEGRSAAGAKIGDLGLRMKQKFLYLFDYGDEHHFEVQLVGINPEAPKGRYPKIVEKHGKPPQQYGDW